jgi:hypothetical protein
MNVYQAIKLAAACRWKIYFTDSNNVLVAKDAAIDSAAVIAREHYDSPNGIVTPVTALIRAITKARTATYRNAKPNDPQGLDLQEQ